MVSINPNINHSMENNKSSIAEFLEQHGLKVGLALGLVSIGAGVAYFLA